MDVLSRRHALERIGKAALVLTGSAAAGAALWDKGGLGIYDSGQRPQTRDFRLREGEQSAAELAIAKKAGEPEQLVRDAVQALGGMQRFIARGDLVVIKPNIGWDRTPVHA